MQGELPLMEIFGSKMNTDNKSEERALKWNPPIPPSQCLHKPHPRLFRFTYLVSCVQKKNGAAETWVPRTWRDGS